MYNGTVIALIIITRSLETTAPVASLANPIFMTLAHCTL